MNFGGVDLGAQSAPSMLPSGNAVGAASSSCVAQEKGLPAVVPQPAAPVLQIAAAALPSPPAQQEKVAVQAPKGKAKAKGKQAAAVPKGKQGPIVIMGLMGR